MYLMSLQADGLILPVFIYTPEKHTLERKAAVHCFLSYAGFESSRVL
jgi:hypothetical protein